MVVILKIAFSIQARLHRTPTEPVYLLVFHMISAVAQQDINISTKAIQIRLTLFALILTSYMLYNYYSSTVTGVLLSQNVQGPETIPEIIDSPLRVSFHDTGYQRVLFKERKLRYIEELYQKMVRMNFDLFRVQKTDPIICC